MAKVDCNGLLSSISGRVGDLVYRRVGRQTIAQRPPQHRPPRSAGQRKTQGVFGGGSAFAAEIVKPNSELRALYAQRGRRRHLNFRQVAIRDFFHPPHVDALNRAGYSPSAGGPLVISASDDFEVVRVTCVLRRADGTIVAFGDAKPKFTHWEYGAPPAASLSERATVAVITAFDRPGNFAVQEFPLR
jgi:hypothetical protein